MRVINYFLVDYSCVFVGIEIYDLIFWCYDIVDGGIIEIKNVVD